VAYTVKSGGGAGAGSAIAPQGLIPVIGGPEPAPRVSMNLGAPGAMDLSWPTVPGYNDTLEWSTNLKDWNDYTTIEGDGNSADLNIDLQTLGNPPDLYLRVRRTVVEP
jgi:hypothetical protein